jgi:hypothetical protein
MASQLAALILPASSVFMISSIFFITLSVALI